jgi:CD109 antigen
MLFTSVDVEALRYLRARGDVDSGTENELFESICQGYQTELMYQHRDGWFAAFVDPGGTGSLWLTAYCLSVFSQARDLITIDDQVLRSAAQWIVDQQQADGGWQPVGFVIHKELEGGLSGDFALSAFVTLALAEYGGGTEAALAQARGYLEAHVIDVTSSHSLAMGAYALAVLESDMAAPTLDRLRAQSLRDDDGNLYWEPVPMEATSYAVLAFHETGGLAEAGSAASWVAAGKNSRGGFGNTQDTVMALRALVRDALAATQSTDVAIEIRRGDEVFKTLRIDASNIDVVQNFLMETGGMESGKPVTISPSGKGQISVQLAKLYNLPADAVLSRGGLQLNVNYADTRVALGGTMEVEAELSYEGARGETNMAIAEIGIPTGLRPDRAALQDLVGKDSIQRIDVERRRIIVYIDRLVSGEPLTIPISFTSAFVAQSAPAPSKAYDYYDPTIEAVHRGLPIVIGEAGKDVVFLRGDANSDGQVDLADAVRILEYLFLEYEIDSCLDRLDADDTGTLDISDPISLLCYLFLGGKPPALPYPEMGADPTEDEIHCLVD